MDNPILFRLAFLVLLIAVRVARLRSRRQTGWSANWPVMKQHPLDTTLLIAVSLLWLLAVILFLVAPGSVARFDLAIPTWLRWSSFVVGIGAAWLLSWADRSLGTNLSVTLQIKKEHTLVTSGPYRWIRHPIYAAGLLFAIAMGCMAANYLLAALFIVPMAVLAGSRMRSEEQMMRRQFGTDYERYMNQTGRLLPRWMANRN